MSTDVDALRSDPVVRQLLTEEHARTAEAIATALARRVCGPMCEHPSCTTYRFSARIARQHGATPPHIPTQPRPGDRP